MKKIMYLLVFILSAGMALATCVDLDDPSTYDGKVIADTEYGGFSVQESVTLCPNTYNLNGSIKMTDYNLVLDCDGATLVGPGATSQRTGIVISTFQQTYFTYPMRATVRNCNIRDFHTGIVAVKARENVLENNDVQDCLIGIFLNGAVDTTVSNNILHDNEQGIKVASWLYSVKGDFNTLEENVITSSSEYGIYIFYADNMTINRNIISDSDGYGIYIQGSADNKIYDNILNNTKNAYVPTASDNEWSITPVSGKNIVGGPSKGGNYWKTYSGTDSDNDGFGDTPHSETDMKDDADDYPLVEWTGYKLVAESVYSNVGPLASQPQDTDDDSGRGFFSSIWAFITGKKTEKQPEESGTGTSGKNETIAASKPAKKDIIAVSSEEECNCTVLQERIKVLMAKIAELEEECEDDEDYAGSSLTRCSSNSDCSRREFCKKTTGLCKETGVCKAIPEACTADWRPVCGCDGKTYGNECAASSAGQSVQSRDACDKEGDSCTTDADCHSREYCRFSTGKCSGTGECAIREDVCPDDYSPVCACNWKTYSNKCFASSAGISIWSDGSCPEVATTQTADDEAGDDEEEDNETSAATTTLTKAPTTTTTTTTTIKNTTIVTNLPTLTYVKK